MSLSSESTTFLTQFPVCLYVRVYIRSLHLLVRTYKLYVAFVTYSIGARPKNATLLLHDALACLSAPQTDHYHFTGRRQWRHCVATSTRAPALRAPRVPRTPSGYPAPYHAARHQLVPCSVKSVLGFRAVQLACRFTLHWSCLASRLCAIGFLSHSYLRDVIAYTTVKKNSISLSTTSFTAFLCYVGRVPI
jgi:hypothetical protein